VGASRGQFADALSNDNQWTSDFFFSPYFSTAEKKKGWERATTCGADLQNFLEAADRAPPPARDLPDRTQQKFGRAVGEG